MQLCCLDLFQCSKVLPEEVPLLEMCKNGHKMPKRKEKSYKSRETQTEEYFLLKNTTTKSVRDIGINTVARNVFSTVSDDDNGDDDDDGDENDGGVELVSQSFRAPPPRSPFATDQPLFKTEEIVEQEYIVPNKGSLVGNLFAMGLSSVCSTEDKSKGVSYDVYNNQTCSGEQENSLPPVVHRVDSLATSDPQATYEGIEDEVVIAVSTEHENENLPKGCYLGLRVGKEGRIYVKSEPDDEHFEQEIIDETRMKQEICQDDDDGDNGDVARFSILDLLPDHPANDDSGSNSNSKPIPCDKCEKSFKKLSHLKRHMLIHTNMKPYACKICSKSFREANCLKKHIRTHTGEKPYHCSICDKAFSQSQNLNKHMNIHTGNKPHKCKACGKAFSQHSHLARHKLIHTGEKPYQCTKCGKSYRTSSHLARHHKSSKH